MGNSSLLPRAKTREAQRATKTEKLGGISLASAEDRPQPPLFPSGRRGGGAGSCRRQGRRCDAGASRGAGQIPPGADRCRPRDAKVHRGAAQSDVE